MAAGPAMRGTEPVWPAWDSGRGLTLNWKAKHDGVYPIDSSLLLENSSISAMRFAEKFNAQFRAEFFNITNHPSFALPSNILAAPNFGALFTTPDAAQDNVGLGSGGPRLVQFALKLSF